MTTYYVGPSSAGLADGSSWANRYGSLNDAEDTPVTGGDIVIVGPGIYREQLTCDVDGASEIIYRADVTGKDTDGIGGDVIISGSDGDTTATRSYCIYASGVSYRTFIGFHLVGFSSQGISMTSCDHVVIKDVCISTGDLTTTYGIRLSGTYDTVEVSRCVIVGPDQGISIYNASDQSATAFTVSNCLITANNEGIFITNVDSVLVENCTAFSCEICLRVTSLASETSITARNCLFFGASDVNASVAGEIASIYCVVSGGSTNWSAGTGDVEDYVMNLQFPILYGTYSGIRYPVPLLGELNPYAYAGAVTGSSETSTDLFGITKPTTASKSSWGAIQFQCHQRETTTTRGGSTASVRFEDAGEMQIWVPVDGSEITVSVYCYREANYAGTNPRLVIKEPGSADRTTTDAAAASQWNELTDTFTPSGDTDYVVVCLQSLNTAVAGDYEAFFDDLTVS